MLDVRVSDMSVESSPIRPDCATSSLIMSLICGAIANHQIFWSLSFLVVSLTFFILVSLQPY